MASVLSLKDWRIANIRRFHSALKGTRLIGAGMFCRVFEIAGSDRVLKLTADRSHVSYLTDGLAPQGVHRPIVYEDHGEVGETFAGIAVHLLEVERLRKISRGSQNARIVRGIVKFVDAFGVGVRSARFPVPDDELSWVTPELGRFMEDLNFFIPNFDCRIDAHWANFMERADGTLVFSDPVHDHKARQISEARRAA